MKPDKIMCQNCSKQIARGRWCSDKCRKSFNRKSDTNPDKLKSDIEKSDKIDFTTSPEVSLGFKLTETDKTFYNRAMKDFGEPYYGFGEHTKERECILPSCGKKFKTSLSLLKYCSYKHYTDALARKSAG